MMKKMMQPKVHFFECQRSDFSVILFYEEQ